VSNRTATVTVLLYPEVFMDPLMTAVTFRVLALSLAAFAGIAAGGARPSLYQRLGGKDGVANIANTLIDRVAADPSLKRSFEGSNLGRIKNLLAEQICDLSGGPCHYSGDSMKEVHAGHQISQAEFYGMVATLREVLKADHVSQGASNELVALLAPMKRDIVEAAPAGAR
jgi:hemoglobin